MFSDPEVARTAIVVTLVNLGLTLFLAVGSYFLAHGLLNAVHHFADKKLFREKSPSPFPPTNGEVNR